MSIHLVCTNDIKCIAAFFFGVQNDDIIKCIVFWGGFRSQEEKVGETEGGKIHST